MIPVLVASGKGGVGKTTVAYNLALALAAKGVRVSVLDADLMAPNMHLFFDVRPEDVREVGSMLLPLKVADNVEFMGLGAFVPPGVGIALNYEKTMDFVVTLLRFVKWSGDYLIIDSPPASIDVNIKLFRELEGRARAVLVGEPHPFSIEDNARMMDLFKYFNIELRAAVLNKYNLFPEEDVRKFEEALSAAGVRVFKVPWDPELLRGAKPSLFEDLARAVV